MTETLKKHTLKKVIFSLMMLFLMLPALQSFFRFIEYPPLYGVYEVSEKPSLKGLNCKTWFNSTFQKKITRSVEDHIGFREFLVRLYNQINYNLFGITENINMVIGKNRCIFEEGYILAALGRNFVGKSHIEESVRRIKWLQDFFKREKNIDIILVFSPGKGCYHSELIPDYYQPGKKELSNYAYFVECCRKENVKYLDLQNYFLQLKDTVRYPLYLSYGVHWSTYGMVLAADTLVRFIEQVRNIDMPEFDFSRVVLSDTVKDVDAEWDAEQALNLLCALPYEKVAYPVVRFIHDTAYKQRPSVLVISDSYYWSVFNSGIMQHCCKSHQFWYYNHLIYPWIWDSLKFVKDLNIKQEIESQDVIIVMATDMNLYRNFWGFTDNLYRWYCPEYRENKLYDAINEECGSDYWLRRNISEARKRKISVEENILINAKKRMEKQNKI